MSRTKLWSLTDEQRRLLARVVDIWRAVAFTGPTDHKAAEEGLAEAYRSAGLAPPERVVWLPNPREGLVVAQSWSSWVRPAWGSVWWPLVSSFNERAKALAPRVFDEVGAATSNLEGEIALVDREVWSETWRTAHAALSPFGTLADFADLSSCAAMADCDFLGRIGVDVSPLAGLLKITRACYQWWPFDRGAVLVERPKYVNRDDRGRPHSSPGSNDQPQPAVQFGGGWGFYAWHGVVLPDRLVLDPDSVKLGDLKRYAEAAHVTRSLRGSVAEENRARLHALIDRLGPERVLRLADNAEIAHAAAGQMLYRVPIKGDEPVMIAKVRCPSTGNEHLLRVPPTVTTCRQAVAWSFGLEAEQYAPEVES